MSRSVRPHYRDPVYDGAADPTLIWNKQEQCWWMVYTSRRAFSPAVPGVAWVHGSALGVAASTDQGRTWTYRGDLAGLDTGWGRWTYWAPEILFDGQIYHMFVSVIKGVPEQWDGHPRRIRHYASPDLVDWQFRSTLELSSELVLDACVAKLPTGGYRLWYKDEAHSSHTWAADSPDLDTWTVIGPAVTGFPHEGPNVFWLGDRWWMIVDAWHGQQVLWSRDATRWVRSGLILDTSGTDPEDRGFGYHADVVPTTDDTATVFYFTHPGRQSAADLGEGYEQRRSTVWAAQLHVNGDTLVCTRDEAFVGPPLPSE